MGESEYFKKALSDFTYDSASGGAIRHLADLGYPARQIAEQLSFPVPYERVRQTVWRHLLDRGVILLDEPKHGMKRQTIRFVREYDKFGRASFRRVTISGSGETAEASNGGKAEKSREAAAEAGNVWVEKRYTAEAGSLLSFLAQKTRENGEENSYISCGFGALRERDPDGFLAYLDVLAERQRDYILGLPWEGRTAYHRLEERMREIVAVLYENGRYQGTAYFTETGEKIRIQ